MFTISEFFVFSFLIGLTGALAPGPTLIATIRSSIEKGWTAGPEITLGHMAIEAFFAIVIIFGLSGLFSSYTKIIALTGGTALLFFGILNIKEGFNAPFNVSGGRVSKSPIAAGIITSAANPYFWLWWLTIGSGFLLDGIKGGILMAGAFLAGHWLADFLWFSFVSLGISKGRTIMPERIYRKIISGCGVFLVIFGIYYIVSVTGFY
ncbi:LysE family translocator [Methanomicrobium antiquum]|uniref:LysE family translocator n=1 Tax=Methanomicrobium antiquum TaxID=487686 RepID=A0AAF0JTZ2_9EURY|nr:LysE family transporter [Methanomicrobium antiquum]WFN37003.1 LysE family translocator [Methanomicrobium antiquum]